MFATFFPPPNAFQPLYACRELTPPDSRTCRRFSFLSHSRVAKHFFPSYSGRTFVPRNSRRRPHKTLRYSVQTQRICGRRTRHIRCSGDCQAFHDRTTKLRCGYRSCLVTKARPNLPFLHSARRSKRVWQYFLPQRCTACQPVTAA